MIYISILLARSCFKDLEHTSRHAGPDTRMMAIPARPEPVERAYIVSSCSESPLF